MSGPFGKRAQPHALPDGLTAHGSAGVGTRRFGRGVINVGMRTFRRFGHQRMPMLKTSLWSDYQLDDDRDAVTDADKHGAERSVSSQFLLRE